MIRITKNIFLNKMTSRARYTRVNEMKREEEEDEPFTFPEDEEDEDDIRPEDLSYTQALIMACCDRARLRLIWDRAGQEIRVDVLNKQYELLNAFATKEEDELQREQAQLDQRLAVVKQLYNQKLAELDPAEIDSMTVHKARLHVQSMMKTKDQIELNRINNKAFEVKRRRIGLDLVVIYMNYLDKQRTDSQCVLHDMQTVKVVNKANMLGKNVHEIDIKTYRDEMEKNVQGVVDRIKDMSLISERVADVDAIKQEATELAKADKETALDVLFKEAKTKVAVKTKTSQQQRNRQVEYA
jgi:hypothetical protein